MSGRRPWLVAWEASSSPRAPEPALGPLFSRFGHDVVLAIAAGLCVWVGFALADTGERRAWRWIGAGIAAWTLGEIYYTAVLWTAEEIPIPSPADGGYLLFPPLTLVGMFALMRTRTRDVPAALGGRPHGRARRLRRRAPRSSSTPCSAAASGQGLEIAVGLAYPMPTSSCSA